jgi:SAM-dependent methyltransferase
MKLFGRTWNALGDRNAYGAILTGAAGTLPEWDANAFFDTGRADAAAFLRDLDEIAPSVKRTAALDFGCGVGRITRSLAAEFESVVGVDAAPTMLARANALNGGLANCAFVRNQEPRLACCANDSFTVVYSRLVLQHLPPALAAGYVRELIRVLAPGGVLMFQLPEPMGSPLKNFLDAPVTGDGLKQRLPRSVIRAYRCLKYAYLVVTSGPRMKMYGLPYEQVADLVVQSGGTVVRAVPDQSHGVPEVRGFAYWVRKPN